MQDDDNNDLDEIIEDAPQTPEQTTETPPETTPPEAPAETPQGPSKTPEDDKGAGAETPPAEPAAPPAEESKTPAEESDKPAEEPAKPLTAEEARKLWQDIRDQERNSTKALDETEQEILKAYYPQGLSNTLVDESTGKELRTPQDVVDASGGQMSMEEAANWLMNEQAKLDRTVSEVKKSARELAETNYNFKQGAVRVLEKYQPIFDKYPQLQNKIYKNYMKTVKMDSEKDLILSAPDIEEYYADVMEPYVMAFSYQPQPAAAPGTPAAPASAPAGGTPPAIPESKQTVADRMDVSGDGGGGGDSTADPNDPEASLNNLFGE